ncbi:MAG: hypothetical protein HQK49_04815 [Oligoflexia bacterium]|nr:hypothetical protein [Oligoflexia bacterium]
MEFNFNLSKKQKELMNTLIIVLVVSIVTTFIYFKINPRPNFTTTIKQAGQMALSAANMAQQPADPPGTTSNVLPPGPVAGGQIQNINPNLNPNQNANQGQYISGGQYVCSQCGHTGLPNFDQNGVPHCSECGGVMNINRVEFNEAVQICANNNCPNTNIK